MFHGPAIFLFPGKACFDMDDKRRIRAGRGGYSFLARNKTLGMPRTADTPWSFHEFAVVAGEPLTVMMYWGVRSSMEVPTPLGTQSQVHGESCGPVTFTFVPESGKDYDTRMVTESGYCRAALRELTRPTPDTAVADATPLTPAPAKPCPKSAASGPAAQQP